MRYATIIILSIALLISKAGAIEESPEQGKSAPVFELKDINGKNTALSDFRGRVVLLNFWAVWCGPCKEEMPSLNNLYKSFKDKGFAVLGVSVDTSEKSVRSFITDKNIEFPILMDKDKDVYFDLYAVMGIPVSFLIDREGIIVEKITGMRDWDSSDIKSKILRLLASGAR